MLRMEASHSIKRSKNLLGFLSCSIVICQLLISTNTITFAFASSGILKGSEPASHVGYERVKLVAIKTSDKMLDSLQPKSIEIPSAKFMMSKVDLGSVEMPHSIMKDEMLMSSIKGSSKIGDLTEAAGEHKKYVLVKKKPKMKKIKMEVYKPKMKYKKIKIKVPVKKMKKKKVKGYMVKKHHDHY